MSEVSTCRSNDAAEIANQLRARPSSLTFDPAQHGRGRPL